MKILHYLRSLAGRFLRRSRIEDELEEELRSHMAHRADDLVRAGLDRAEAERRAGIEFGGRERVKEECRDALGGTTIETILQDVRVSARLLRKAPAFTAVAVITLALAIGANAVVFAALNAVIFRPLDVPRPDSLYSIHRVKDYSAAQSYPSYLDLRDRNRTFEDLAAINFMNAGLDTGDANPLRVWIVAASGNYFDVLGIQPHAGRFFHASDEHGPNSAPYVVVSHAFWHAHFHDDRSVVGRVVQLNKHPFTIVGVAPAGFRGTLLFFTPDFFMPMVNQQQIDGTNALNARGNRFIFMTLGHLKAGVTPDQAAADFNAISADLERTYPKDYRHVPLELKRPSLYGDYLGRPVRAFLTALMVLAGLILLAACANLGSLFAARAADRSREVALRLALGASRLRVLRQLFTEAIMISLAGGALGLWGGAVLLQVLTEWRPFPQFPINIPVSPDATVYAVALLLALASGALFGAVPVRQVLRTDPYEVVKAGARVTAERRFTFRDLLVVAQIAICAVLVTSSLVAVRGLLRSMHADLGFEPRQVMLADAVLDMAGYKPAEMAPMQKRMIEAMQTIGGVTAVGASDNPPLATGGANATMVFTDDTSDFRPANAAFNAATDKVSPGYFEAAGTPLRAGRAFTWHDDADAPRVAVVNVEFSRRIFGSAAGAVGRYYRLKDGTRIQIVGVAENGKYTSLTENQESGMFLPMLQFPSGDTWLVVRAGGDPRPLAAAIRNKMRTLDAGLPVFVQPWSEAMGLALFPSRVATVALSLLGAIGAMLSITGIFGLAAYTVSRRMRELGIRIALGGQSRDVLAAALGRALRLLVFGSVAGLALGLLATRVLASIVYQATPRDPLVLTGAVLVMFVLGLVATWIPARRALSANPLRLLREE